MNAETTAEINLYIWINKTARRPRHRRVEHGLTYCTPLLLVENDECVRDASGGFVMITTASWYLPAAQSTQVLASEAPVAAEILPGGQSVQASRTSVYTWAESLVVLSPNVDNLCRAVPCERATTHVTVAG